MPITMLATLSQTAAVALTRTTRDIHLLDRGIYDDDAVL